MDHNLYLKIVGNNWQKKSGKIAVDQAFSLYVPWEKLLEQDFLNFYIICWKQILMKTFFNFLIKTVEKLDKSNANMQAV